MFDRFLPKLMFLGFMKKCHCYIFLIFYKAPKPSTLVENNQTSKKYINIWKLICLSIIGMTCLEIGQFTDIFEFSTVDVYLYKK